jgi:hypothetical protein
VADARDYRDADDDTPSLMDDPWQTQPATRVARVDGKSDEPPSAWGSRLDAAPDALAGDPDRRPVGADIAQAEDVETTPDAWTIIRDAAGAATSRIGGDTETAANDALFAALADADRERGEGAGPAPVFNDTDSSSALWTALDELFTLPVAILDTVFELV